MTPAETGTRRHAWRASARPRSSTRPSQVLAEVGYDLLTMDAVAARAKASKATLYRRWKSKPELVVAAVMCAPERHRDRPGHRLPARRPAGGVLRHRRPQRPGGPGRPDRGRHRDGPRPRVRRGLPPRLHRAEDRRLPRDLRAGPRARRGRTPTSTSPSSPRPWPGSSCTGPSCSATPSPPSSSGACSTRSSSRRHSTAPWPLPLSDPSAELSSPLTKESHVRHRPAPLRRPRR